MDANIDPTNTFKELFGWIVWDIDYNHNLNKDNEGNFYINKLYITPTHLSYKTECSEIAEGLFEKVEVLWELLNEK